MLSTNFSQHLPPNGNTVVAEYFTLADRLESFNSTTGIGLIHLGSYNNRLKGNYVFIKLLQADTVVETNTALDFYICMSALVKIN